MFFGPGGSRFIPVTWVMYIVNPGRDRKSKAQNTIFNLSQINSAWYMMFCRQIKLICYHIRNTKGKSYTDRERLYVPKVPEGFFRSEAANNREFTKLLRLRQGLRRLKNEFIFELRISRYSEVIYIVYHCQNYHESGSGTLRWIWNRILKIYPLWFTFFRQRRSWSFHVVVLQRTAKKCTKNYNARAHLLFCSLNLLFSDVPVAEAVVVFLGPVHTYPDIFESATLSFRIQKYPRPHVAYSNWIHPSTRIRWYPDSL